MDRKSKNRMLIAMIVALMIIIAALTSVVIMGGKKQNEKNEKTAIELDTATDTITAEDVTTETKESETATDASEKVKSDIEVNISCNNNWEAEGKVAGQFDLSINNKSKQDKENWKIELTLAKDVKLDNVWNAKMDIKDGKVTITPVDYNGKVAAGSTVKDIGFILMFSSENDIKDISKDIKLYFNNEEYVSDAGSNTDDSDDANNADEKSDEADSKVDDSNKEPSSAVKEDNPYKTHGKLQVKGVDLCDENGNPYQLKGISTHGIAWFPDFVNEDALKTLRDDWGANLFRIAMYTDESGGYCSSGNKDDLKALVDKGVQAATDLGMYVIVDWHILHDLNPQVYKEDAKLFFDEVSKKYKDNGNVIYEICNEPNGDTKWSDVKSYAEEIIPIIRANDKDAIIIVGTPTWSQDVDIAAKDPVTGYDNIMYAIHFYAATHTDNIRNKVTTARNAGLPVFVSEFSICDASGNGAIDYDQAEKWFQLINDNNMSYAAWSLCNKNETSALIKQSCIKKSDWSTDDLSDAGLWIRKQILGEN